MKFGFWVNSVKKKLPCSLTQANQCAMEDGNGTISIVQKKQGRDLLLGAKTIERQNLARKSFKQNKIYRIVIEEHGTLHLIVDPG